MLRYQLKDLVNVDEVSFKRKIDEFLQLQDYEMEGFRDPAKQRDLSIRFQWGHDHDFGNFSLKGRMRDRHLRLLATFMDRFGALPRSLTGLKILDIGCWTGGTSLLLCAMGAQVVAIEEVKKYVDCLNYMKHAFNIENLEPRNLSIYECTTPEFQETFDIVLFAGVLYHVTDPILALRITFDSMKDGGVLLLETAIAESKKPILYYLGPSQEGPFGGGWNWFFPSTSSLSPMMMDVGYTDVKILRTGAFSHPRAFAVASRGNYVDMARGGLSARWVR